MTGASTVQVHAPGDGEANAAFGLQRWFRITTASTNDAFCVFEEEVPEGDGPPLHIHHTEHEMFTVLSGNVRFKAGEIDTDGSAGYTIVIPPGTAHAFKGLGPGSAWVLIMLSPGRGEGFFRDVEAEGLSAPEDMPRIIQIAQSYNIEFVGPPL